MTARWLRLAMINYEVEAEVLRSRVPVGTELDLWEGRCFVSVVGFRFVDTRVLGIVVPFHSDFVEVNLRFYVKRVMGDEVRRGVVFVKEVVPRWVIAWAANAIYGERYVALPMSNEDADGRLSYQWSHGGRTHGLHVSFQGDPYDPPDHSEARFITEHYWGYATQRDGTTLEYKVEHPPWRLLRAHAPQLDCDVAAFYGQEFATALASKPASCFIAEGSEVLVRKGTRLPTHL